MVRQFIVALASLSLIGSYPAVSQDLSAEPARTEPLIDGHNDLFIHYMDCKDCPREIDSYDISAKTDGDTDIPRLRRGDVGAILLNVFHSGKETKDTLAGFDFLRRLVARYSADLEIAETAEDVRRIHSSGKIAIIATLEGANRLENSPLMLRTLRRLGLRAVTLAYSTNDLADGSNDLPKHGGLSDLGREMVREMNSCGVLVDLSHTSAETMQDVLNASTAPVIFSHSSAKALVDVPRNVPDDVLKRLPANGGIVMVSLVPYFTTRANAEWVEQGERFSNELITGMGDGTILEDEADKRWAEWNESNPEPVVTVSDVADHIEHIRRVAGVEHIGIGSDFDGMPSKIRGLEDVSTFPVLIGELKRRGWRDGEIDLIRGGNFLRVLAQADRVSLSNGCT